MLSLCLSFGCVSSPKPPEQPKLSQLQIRQLQIKEYSDVEPAVVMKSVISALQDEGYIIGTANENLGLISAAKEVFEEDASTKGYVKFMYGAGVGTYQTTKRFETTATVRKHQKVIRVRINIIAKALTNAGGIVWSQPVYDGNFYQILFSKIDKAIFIEKQNI
ncbi:MAG: hypothetical protein QF858_01365 [Candidatus Pacebacteria bacterium]|nr:hypothetical protein [Candidatus Paceibacterota bacterium]